MCKHHIGKSKNMCKHNIVRKTGLCHDNIINFNCLLIYTTNYVLIHTGKGEVVNFLNLFLRLRLPYLMIIKIITFCWFKCPERKLKTQKSTIIFTCYKSVKTKQAIVLLTLKSKTFDKWLIISQQSVLALFLWSFRTMQLKWTWSIRCY